MWSAVVRRGTWILGGLAVLAIAVLAVLWALAEKRARSSGIRADSLEAVADTQRSVAGVQVRRIVQLEGELSRATVEESLRTRPRVVIRTVVRVDTVRGAAEGSPVVDSADVRSGSVVIRDEPFTVELQRIEMPPPPAPVRIPSYRIGVDPFSLVPRVSCSEERFNGVRRAYIAFDSLPSWARVQILEAQASAGVCNPRTGFGLSVRVPVWTVPAAFIGGVVAGILTGVVF